MNRIVDVLHFHREKEMTLNLVFLLKNVRAQTTQILDLFV